MIADVACERGVLAGLCTFGADAYYDVADILSERTFTIDSNQAIYKCIKSVIEQDEKAVIDVTSIYSASNRLGLDYLLKKTEEAKHLHGIMTMPVFLPNVRKHAAVIRKLEIARLLQAQLKEAQSKLNNITGTEPITQILGIAEDTIFDFTSCINNSRDEEPKLLVDGLTEYLKFLADNPVKQMGIPSPYALYNQAIGGGFRKGSVSMIGARTKAGKSVLAINISAHVASAVKVPVLYLDTEMMDTDQRHRLMAMLTETPINDIETGQFGQDAFTKKRVLDMAKSIEDRKVPISYKNISGAPFEEILAIIRRWILKEVGVNDDGTAKDCLIIYDYLKLMTSEGLSADMKEYQMLGFMMTGLHNFAVRYQVPVLSFIQLNRDGIDKESTAAAAGSDRIMWLCSNFSIYKFKSDDEIAEDSLANGNRKLVPIMARHGGGLENGDYINMMMTGKYAKIVEGKTAFEVSKEDEGFVTNDDGNTQDEIPFD